MNKQHLQSISEDSQKVSRIHPFNSHTIIVATCLFFGSMSVAMADACSSKQIADGCTDQTSSTGYKWCKCDPKSFKKGGNDMSVREPGAGGIGNLKDIPKKTAPAR